MKTANYKGKLVYVKNSFDRMSLVTYKKDGTKLFKVDNSELTEITS